MYEQIHAENDLIKMTDDCDIIISMHDSVHMSNVHGQCLCSFFGEIHSFV